MIIKPIGIFRTTKVHPYEAARQGTVDAGGSIGTVELHLHQQFEQALDGLQEFSHIWLLYQFHHNKHWKPKVLPPRGSSTKKGVFATRSPYRPNPIGMSCVELIEIKNLKIFVRHHDLLDETPILDIKPYLPYADSFPQASLGWLKLEPYDVIFSDHAEKQIYFLERQGLTEFRSFLLQQLEFDPVDSRKKRVATAEDDSYVIAYQTWRAQFKLEGKQIHILRVFSALSDARP